MLSSTESDRRIGPATAGSIALHVLLALSVPALAFTATSSTPVETIAFQRIPLITIETRPILRRVERRATAPHYRAKPVVIPAPRRPELTAPHAPRTLPRPAVAAHPPAAPNVAPVAAMGSGTAAAGAADPATTASPAPRQVPSTGHVVGGYLPFGATQPDPVLDPAVHQALLALGVHTTLTVVVGDDGKTRSVSFDPLPDAQTQARIRALLADANWDPAVCGGGIACRGSTTIRL